MNKIKIFKKIFICFVSLSMIVCNYTIDTKAVDVDLDAASVELYENSYNILKNRVTDRGYSITSLTGAYNGMFTRDSSIQAMAHLAYGDTNTARSILKYLLSYHVELDLKRATHIVDNLQDEEYRNTYLNALSDEKENTVKYYTEQTNTGVAQFKINASNNAAATAFIPDKSAITSVSAYLTTNPGATVVAEIYEDLLDKTTLLGKGSLTVSEGKDDWHSIQLENTVTVEPGKTYYLKFYATEGSPYVALWGIGGDYPDYQKSWNYDLSSYGGNGWKEVNIYSAFKIDKKEITGFTSQTNNNMLLFKISDGNKTAQPFIPTSASIDSVKVGLNYTNSTDKVKVMICTDYKDESTAIASTTYTFGDNGNGWQTIPFDDTVTVQPGQTYYLVLQATQDSGYVAWGGTQTAQEGYMKAINYENSRWSIPSWGAYPAFEIISDSSVDEGYYIAQRNDGTDIFNIGGGRKSAQAFIPKNDTINNIEVNLKKTSNNDKVQVLICTDYKDESSAIASTTYTFNENASGWQTITFDKEVNVEPGKTYYLLMYSSTNGVLWRGTTSSKSGYLNSYNYENGNWSEKPYYPAFEVNSFNQDSVVQSFEARGNSINSVNVDMITAQSKGSVKVDIRTDYKDSSTSIGSGTVNIDSTGSKTYVVEFGNDISVVKGKTYYAVISLEDTEGYVKVETDTTALSESYEGATWDKVGYEFLMNANFDVDRVKLMTITNDINGVQEIPVSGEVVTGVKAILSRSSDSSGTLKATLYKGYGDNGQVIDTDEITISELSEKGDWVTFKFGLPLVKTQESENYYLKLETVDSIGEVYWLGSSSIDNYDTLLENNHGSQIINGEASYEALKSTIKLISDYTQTDGNYMLIHAWAMYVNNNEGTEEDKDFIEQSYPIIAKFADYYINSADYWNSEMNLIYNPSLEHSRLIRYWQGYDLLTNVFASQALHELSEVAEKMNDTENSSRWKDYSEKLTSGIKNYFITEYDGKKIYGEFYDIQNYESKKTEGMTFYKGMSWINLAPVAAEWYAIDDEIMKNTFEIYGKYASIKMYGYDALATEATLATEDLEYVAPHELIGKGLSWELMYNAENNNTDRVKAFLGIELATAEKNNTSVYPEFWKSESYVTDPGNQEHCSWQIYAMSLAFPELTKTYSIEKLKLLIDEAKTLDENIYTEDTYKVLVDEIDDAINVLENESSKEKFDQAYDELLTVIESLKYKLADYTKVNEAKAKIPTDLSVYTEETVKALEDAVNAVEEGLDITKQVDVDAAAKAIEDAVAALKLKPADYTKVDQAIAKVPADLSGYTDETVKGLKDVLALVDRNKDITKQDEVDAYAQAIENALAGLQLKPADKVTETGDNTLVEMFAAMTMISLCGLFLLNKKRKES